MDTTEYIFDNLKKSQMGSINLQLSNLLKLPLGIILFGNILYAFILLLRIRILADTFESSGNAKIKILIYAYLGTAVVGGLIALLFVVLG